MHMSNSLLKNSAIYGLGKIFSKGIGFLLIPLYTHYFTVEEYGVLALLNLLMVLLSFVFQLGVGTSVVRFHYEEHSDPKYQSTLYGNALLLALLSPLLLCVLVGPLLYWVANRFYSDIPFFPYILIVLLIGLIAPVKSILEALLRAQQRAVATVTFQFLFFVCQAGIIVINVAILGYGLKGQLYAQLISNLIFWGISIILITRESVLRPSLKMCRNLLALGVPMLPFFFASWLYEASGRFMLESFVGLAEVGIFALALQFGWLLPLFGDAFDSAIMPFFYDTARKEDAASRLGEFIVKYIAFFGIMSLGLTIIAEPAVLFMADEKYHKANDYIPWLIIAGWFQIMYRPIRWSLMQSKRSGLLSILRTVSTTCLLILTYLFLDLLELGISGVICAVLIVGISELFFGYVVAQKQYLLDIDLKRLAFVLPMVLAAIGIVNYVRLEMNIIASVLLQLSILIATTFFVAKIAGIGKLIGIMRFYKW